MRSKWPKIIWQKAASLSCFSSRRPMHSSVVCAGQTPKLKLHRSDQPILHSSFVCQRSQIDRQTNTHTVRYATCDICNNRPHSCTAWRQYGLEYVTISCSLDNPPTAYLLRNWKCLQAVVCCSLCNSTSVKKTSVQSDLAKGRIAPPPKKSALPWRVGDLDPI